MPGTAILGAGISGLTAAWQLTSLGQPVTLLEASGRVGGIVETVRRDGFCVEMGPDSWVTEKPWAAQLARDLSPTLAAELTSSLDRDRVTWVSREQRLLAIPDGMRLMVPTNLQALAGSPLLTAAARAAYAAEPGRAAELKRLAPDGDESVASFVLRHFGPEVLETLAAPLLSGVFGGDVHTLSVRAVMPTFVEMERAEGSLILALQNRQRAVHLARAAALDWESEELDEPETTPGSGGTPPPPSIFTTIRSGLGSLTAALASALPHGMLHLNQPVSALSRKAGEWCVRLPAGEMSFDRVILATPAHVTAKLLAPQNERLAELHQVPASSAILLAFAFRQDFPLPKGFGFLVPESEPGSLLAATFVDQKFPGRVPPGCRLLRAFIGGSKVNACQQASDESLASLALRELQTLLGPLPTPEFHLVRRWPRSLPQYGVGHAERMAEAESLRSQMPGLYLLGNTYRGVGLPDLIRDARSLARRLAAGEL